MFDELKKVAKLSPAPAAMPFTEEVSEKTKLMTLDTWICRQIRERESRLVEYPQWSKEKREGYLLGITDMALDMKNEVKKLKT